MTAVDPAEVRRFAQYEVTAAERAGRHVSRVLKRDVPALCDEVDRLRAIVASLFVDGKCPDEPLTVDEALAQYEKGWAETTRAGLVQVDTGLIDVRWKAEGATS